MKNKIIMILVSIIIITVGYFLLKEKYNKKDSKIIIGNKPYFISAGKIDEKEIEYDRVIVRNYIQYKEISDKYEMQYFLNEKDFDKYDYITLILENNYCGGNIKNIEDLSVNESIDIVVNIDGECKKCSTTKYIYFVRVEKNIATNKKINIKYQHLSKCN